MLLLKYCLQISFWLLIFHVFGLKQILLDYSIQYLPEIKQEQSWFVWALGVVGGEIGQSWAIVISHHYFRRDQALIVITALTIGNTFNTLLKTFWQEPRPYLLSELIVPARCKNFEYGLPSGHTMGFMLVYRTLTKLIESKHQHLIQVVVFGAVLLVSYNRS